MIDGLQVEEVDFNVALYELNEEIMDKWTNKISVIGLGLPGRVMT